MLALALATPATAIRGGNAAGGLPAGAISFNGTAIVFNGENITFNG